MTKFKDLKFKNIIIFAIIFFGIFCSAQTSFAKNLYVNNSGTPACSDSTTYANNTALAPWCTLGRALWGNANKSTPNVGEAATAGDTVLVASGTYYGPSSGSRLEPAFNPVNSGTQTSPITIQADGTVTLSTSGTAGGPVFGSNGKDGLVWDGFRADENDHSQLSSGEPCNVAVLNADYVTIKNCTLIGNTVAGSDLNHSGIWVQGSNNVLLFNNHISGVYGGGNNNEGILLYSSNDVTIENNEITNCTSGVFVKGPTCDRIIVRFNKIHGMTYWGVRLQAGADNLVYQNLIYDGNGTTGIGLMSYYGGSTGCKFVNNTVYNMGKLGVFIGSETNEHLYYNNIIHTVTRTDKAAVGSENITNPNVHDFQHNLYYNVPRMWWDEAGGGNRDWAYWTGTWVHDTVATAGVFGSDPLFVNVPGGNFKLQAGSPARTLGRDILNLAGGGTSATIPAGAYITGNETIGLISEISPDTTPPAAPSGVTVS